MKYTITLCILLLLQASALASETAIKTIAYEASSESYQGQVLTASVIKQRMVERGQTAEEVCLAPSQFSCWTNGKPTQRRTITQGEYDTAQRAWEESVPMGYNHYARYDCKPYWIKHAKESKRVGNHIFYVL